MSSSDSETIPINTNEPPKEIKKKCTKRCTLISFTICFVICLFIVGFYYDTVIHIRSIDFNDEHLNGDIEYVSEDDIQARLYHHNHNGINCGYYGCCEIKTSCKPKENFLDAKTIHLNYIARDIIKSNCLSLDQIIHLYNQKYKSKKNCHDTKYGCCPSINTGCDYTFHVMDKNDKKMVDKYINESKNRFHRIQEKKENEHGTNCPKSEYDIIYLYNRGFPKDSYEGTVVLLVILFIIIVCCEIHK